MEFARYIWRYALPLVTYHSLLMPAQSTLPIHPHSVVGKLVEAATHWVTTKEYPSHFYFNGVYQDTTLRLRSYITPDDIQNNARFTTTVLSSIFGQHSRQAERLLREIAIEDIQREFQHNTGLLKRNLLEWAWYTLYAAGVTCAIYTIVLLYSIWKSRKASHQARIAEQRAAHAQQRTAQLEKLLTVLLPGFQEELTKLEETV